MAPRIDQALVAELLGGDPFLTPDEAAARLGIGEARLYDVTADGRVPAVQPGGPNSHYRYRESVITRLAATGIPRTIPA